MPLQIITLYVVCDTYYQQKRHRGDKQARMTDAEVMTVALVAAWFFHGNLRLACGFLREGRYMLRMLEESRFNRRLHRIALEDWQGVLTLLAGLSPQSEFALDSCPLPVCRAARRFRRRLYPDANAGGREDAYLGYCAAKAEWYTGLKAHVVVDKGGGLWRLCSYAPAAPT